MLLQRLAGSCYRNRWRVLGGWAVLVVALVSLNTTAGGEFLDDFDLPGSESQAALDLLEEHGFAARAGFSGQVVVAADDVRDPQVERAVTGFLDEVRGAIGPGEIISPYTPAGTQQISDDGTVAYAELNLDDRDSDEYTALGEEIRELADEANADDMPAGARIELGGDIFAAPPEFASEGFGFLAAMVILLIAFGSVLAMGLPIVTAVFGIVSGISIVGLVVHLMDMPSFTSSSVATIGIGVGIDSSP